MTHATTSGTATAEAADAAWPEHRTFVVRGRVLATAPFVRALLRLDAESRLLFNCAADDRVPFAEGVAYRLALARARRDGTAEPVKPERSDGFQPVPTPFGLNAELTALRGAYPELERSPVSAQRVALGEACVARKRHVGDCVAAKAAGRDMPRRPLRAARDGCHVGTDAFRLERPDRGPTQPRPLTRGATEQTLKNRARRGRHQERDDAAWAETKLRAGKSEEDVVLGLWRRADRRDRARERQRGLQAARDACDAHGPKPKLPRKDSPDAVVGLDVLMLTVQSLPQVRVRLDRPIPKGGTVQRVMMQKSHGRDARVEVRLVLRVPFEKPKLDPFVTGAAIHAAVRHLPGDAPDLALVEAVQAAGIAAVGEDLNVSAPSATSDGRLTRPVTRPRDEVEALKALDRKASGMQRAFHARHEPKPSAVSADLVGPVSPKRPPRYVPSNRARKNDEARRRLHKGWRHRSETRAHQDARLLVAGMAFVATDPRRMAAPLLAKGGPADRRAERVRLGLPADASVPDTSLPAWMTPSRRSALRANLHSTRIALRVDATAALCAARGIIHVTPGHEGTSRQCPGCPSRVRKGLSERTHRCEGCGLVMQRDVASATVTLGRGLRAFRDGPDPGGRLLAALEARREAKADRERKEARRAEARTKRSEEGSAPRAGTKDVVCPRRRGAEHQERTADAVQTETLLNRRYLPDRADLRLSHPFDPPQSLLGASDVRG